MLGTNEGRLAKQLAEDIRWRVVPVVPPAELAPPQQPASGSPGAVASEEEEPVAMTPAEAQRQAAAVGARCVLYYRYPLYAPGSYTADADP